ncbi:MAG: hypothetical protein COA43_08055 [Robiginitomaculum sp.]|nr:MAG: hypothetical protein COA43_08055 [Robiginitomaculum sp.]
MAIKPQGTILIIGSIRAKLRDQRGWERCVKMSGKPFDKHILAYLALGTRKVYAYLGEFKG